MKLARIPTIIVDTREQDPWLFQGKKVRLKRQGLKFGDYSIPGGGVVVERKSMADLIGTLTGGLERFKRELARFHESQGLVLGAVVVEGDPDMYKYGFPWSSANPGRIRDLLYGVCVPNGVAPFFCGTRAEAEALAFNLLRAG